MKKKNCKRVTAFFLALIMCFSTFLIADTSANAAGTHSLPSVSRTNYIEFVSNVDKPVYANSSLTQRGTYSPYKRYNSYIETGDVCRILNYNLSAGWISVLFPTKSGMKQGFISTKSVLASPTEVFTSNAKVPTYRSASTKYKIGNTAKGDTIFRLGKSGNYTIIIYTAKNSAGRAYKLGAVKTTDYNKMKSTASNSTSSVRVNLNVPTFRQYDSRWASVPIGTKNIAKRGCLLCSISMKYSYHTNTTVYPNIMKGKLRFSNNDLVWSSVSALGYSYTGKYACNITNSMMKTIYGKLALGKPVVIGGKNASGGQHWVIITGYKGSSNTSFSSNNFTIIDPNSSSRTTLNQFLAAYPRVERLVY